MKPDTIPIIPRKNKRTCDDTFQTQEEDFVYCKRRKIDWRQGLTWYQDSYWGDLYNEFQDRKNGPISHIVQNNALMSILISFLAPSPLCNQLKLKEGNCKKNVFISNDSAYFLTSSGLDHEKNDDDSDEGYWVHIWNTEECSVEHSFVFLLPFINGAISSGNRFVLGYCHGFLVGDFNEIDSVEQETSFSSGDEACARAIGGIAENMNKYDDLKNYGYQMDRNFYLSRDETHKQFRDFRLDEEPNHACIHSVDISANGRYVLAIIYIIDDPSHKISKLKIWDVDNNCIVFSYVDHTNTISNAHFHPGCKSQEEIVMRYCDTIETWNFKLVMKISKWTIFDEQNMKHIFHFHRRNRQVSEIPFQELENYLRPTTQFFENCIGKATICVGSNVVYIFHCHCVTKCDLFTGEVYHTYNCGKIKNHSELILSKNEKYIGMILNEGVTIYNTQNGKLVFKHIASMEKSVYNLAFSPDEVFVIITYEKTVDIFDIQSGKLFTIN